MIFISCVQFFSYGFFPATHFSMAAKCVFFLDARIESAVHVEKWFNLVYYMAAAFICLGALYPNYKMVFANYIRYSQISVGFTCSLVLVTVAQTVYMVCGYGSKETKNVEGKLDRYEEMFNFNT